MLIEARWHFIKKKSQHGECADSTSTFCHSLEDYFSIILTAVCNIFLSQCQVMVCSCEWGEVSKMFFLHFFVSPKRCSADDVVASEKPGILLPKNRTSEEQQPLVWRWNWQKGTFWFGHMLSSCTSSLNKVCFTHWHCLWSILFHAYWKAYVKV